jgi:hypothetical protein
MAHPSRGNCREGRPVTARKQMLALSRSLAARARAADRRARKEHRIGLQRTEEAIVFATAAPREPECQPCIVLGVKAVEARGIRAA